jgi:hypothetical protein
MRQPITIPSQAYLPLAPKMHMSGCESEAVMSHLSAHADYRHEDYFFARTQSRAMAFRQWEHKRRRHSWSEILVPALGAAAALLVVAEIVL